MSLAPLFTSSCDLATRIPSLIADFLDLETSLRRRFREESVSDMIVASLVRISGRGLSVQVPEDESKTGNDFDIIVFDPPRRTAIQFRIQAKRLTPHHTHWGMGSYVELAHPNGDGCTVAVSRPIRRGRAQDPDRAAIRLLQPDAYLRCIRRRRLRHRNG
jgi:hypothetical protein